MARLTFICATAVGLCCSTMAVSVSDYAVRLSVTVQTNPARVSLSWTADANSLYCALYRKSRESASWGTATSLGAGATNYVDSNVVVGSTYEYQVYRVTPDYD